MAEKEKGNLYWGKTCYGVDLQDDTPVVVRGTRDRSSVKCVRVDPADIMYRGDLRAGAFCVGTVSARESLIRRLEAPYGGISKARKVFPTLLDIQLPFPLEDCVHSFLDVVRTGSETVCSLAIAARKDDVEKNLRLYAAVGMNPAVLDHEGLALWTQSLNEIHAGSLYPSCRIVVYLGKTYTTLVFGRGETLISAHSIKTGDEGRIKRLLQTQFGQSDGDAGRNPEVVWMWCGPGASNDGRVNELHSRLSIDWSGPLVIHDDPETFLARALAVRALQSGQLRCNLRLGRFMHDAITRRNRKRVMKTAILFLVSGLLLCGAMPAVKTIIERKNTRMKDVFGMLVEDLAPGQVGNAKGRDALGIIRSELEKERKELEPFRAAFRPSLRRTIASIMEIGKKNGLRYETISLSENRVEISGSAEDWNSFAELLSFLNVSGDKIKRKDAQADERIPFTIRSDSPGSGS
ncbi:MAG: hypothetical protein KAH23_00605 [Kiritimatiellae bacterium]|nr:hypothetical protein [Kiritimatiellia bacterium]